MFTKYLTMAKVPEHGVVMLVTAISDDKLSMRKDTAKAAIRKHFDKFIASLDDPASIKSYSSKVYGWLDAEVVEDDYDFGE